MATENAIEEHKRVNIRSKFLGKMQCLCSGDQFKMIDEEPASQLHSGGAQPRLEAVNIEEAESSLRENGCLNYEEARALLGRYEYQKGNIEAALHVFEGIDVTSVSSKIMSTLHSRIAESKRRRSQSFDTPPMSMNAVSLLFEAFYLKAKSLQALGKFTEAAQSCRVVLDIVESSFPDGSPNFFVESRLKDTISRVSELLPELCKLSDSPGEAILSYRRVLLRHWDLDILTTSRIQKEFAIYLLYSGEEATTPDLRTQLHSCFVPKNNLEEAILLLMIIFRKATLKVIEWDPAILDHLLFALSICGSTCTAAGLVEELLPGIIERKERYHTLALCYCGNDDISTALNLIRKLLALSSREGNTACGPALMMASKICGENPEFAEDGVEYAQRAIGSMEDQCNQMVGTANLLLGVAVSEHARTACSDPERSTRQLKALGALERADQLTESQDHRIIYQLTVQYAEQRKLDLALRYAKRLLEMESGSSIKTWILLSRVLSAQKRFVDAETIIDAALEQTGRWDQGNLLRTKAKILLAQGHVKDAVETYSQLLAVLQVRRKSLGSGRRHLKRDGNQHDKDLEMQTWLDLADIYISLSQSNDVETCLSKAKAINPHSASICHVTGAAMLFYISSCTCFSTCRRHMCLYLLSETIEPIWFKKLSIRDSLKVLSRTDKKSKHFSAFFLGSLHEAKGEYQRALEHYTAALSIDPSHIPSLISSSKVMRKRGNTGQTFAVARSFLMNALRLDRTNHSAWYNLGILYREQSAFLEEAVECFEAAALLQETAPVEPFR